MTTLTAKLKQKKELSKDYIDSMLTKGINYFFESVNVTTECNLNYTVERVEGNKVHVLFSWIKDFNNYDSSCNSWNDVIGSFSTSYNFSQDKETLLEEIITELEENVTVNF